MSREGITFLSFKPNFDRSCNCDCNRNCNCNFNLECNRNFIFECYCTCNFSSSSKKMPTDCHPIS